MSSVTPWQHNQAKVLAVGILYLFIRSLGHEIEESGRGSRDDKRERMGLLLESKNFHVQ